MKKQLTVALGLAVLATPAFASKARLLALGEDVNGSFYINDNRNIFLNASEVNNHKDLVTLEWGAAGDAGTNDDPNAEGGLYRAHGNMVYGVHFGRNLSFNEGRDQLTAGNTQAASNAIDLFVGGDAGVKWGAQLTYAATEDESATDKPKTDVIDLAAGASHGNIAGYVKYAVKGMAEAGAVEIERKSDLEVGGSYKWDNYTGFGQYRTASFEKGANDFDYTSYLLGIGRNHKLNDKATMFAKVTYGKTTEELANKNETTNLPLTFGMEYDAASWLVLRGSVAQSLYSKVDNNNVESTLSESTTVQAGASLKFGELSVDGVIGSGANPATPTGNTTDGGVINTDSLMSYVSMTYKF